MTEKLKFGQVVKILLTFLIAGIILCGMIVAYSISVSTFEISGEKLATVFTSIFLLLFVLYIYLFFMQRDVFKKIKNVIAIDVILIIGISLNLFIGSNLNVFFRPYAFVALVVTLLLDKRIASTASFVSGLIMLTVDSFFGSDKSFILADLIVGIAASLLYLYLISRDKRRLQTMITALKMCAVLAATAAVAQMFDGFTIEVLYSAIWGAASSLLVIALFMGVLPVFEYAFNFVTDYRLFELTDHNCKLIQELSKNAIGTFNHSIVVANLAEACAEAIGENTNLARAAAYYHDVGKIKNSMYFKENQIGQANPHDDITPEISVEVIKNHVPNGVKTAKNFRLPNEIIDVIREHHGTLPIKVFYYKALKYTDGDLSISGFCYDGPKPKSRISAIMMICDASEAAVRVLTERTVDNVEKVVSAVIEERMALNQFTDCDVTFADIYTIKDVIIKTLSGVYHERVKYPDIKLDKTMYDDEDKDKKETK